MARKRQPKDVLNVPPDEEQGAEAAYGFDYQAHCAARLCLEMLRGHDCDEIVCEHHEDALQIGNSGSPTFCQVKKRESADAWTISLLIGAMEKLFRKLKYKNVGRLVVYGSGRASNHGEYSLADLIALLDRPKAERDQDWERDISEFGEHLRKLLSPEIDCEFIQKGLRLLTIDLSLPNAEAIGAENIRLTSQVISEIWCVEVSLKVAERAYLALYRLVWKASHKPKLPRTEKSITHGGAVSTLREVLRECRLLAENPQEIVDINTKLQKGELDTYLMYALQMRMDARQVKYELNIDTTDWEDFKADIAVEWDKYVSAHPEVVGPLLWKQMRELLRRMGEKWIKKHGNHLLGPHFSEGLFFDMMAVCQADIGV